MQRYIINEDAFKDPQGLWIICKTKDEFLKCSGYLHKLGFYWADGTMLIDALDDEHLAEIVNQLPEKPVQNIVDEFGDQIVAVALGISGREHFESASRKRLRFAEIKGNWEDASPNFIRTPRVAFSACAFVKSYKETRSATLRYNNTYLPTENYLPRIEGDTVGDIALAPVNVVEVVGWPTKEENNAS